MAESLELILAKIRAGRTDLVFELLDQANWIDACNRGPINVWQWLVYFNDLTGIRALLRAGGSLDSIDANLELGNAAFFGHWNICDFLLTQGADPNFQDPSTGETALHSALAKPGRPYYQFVVRVLLENGANPNLATIPGRDTGAFMRDVRTCGETALHRAAAYGDESIIQLLLDHGAQLDARDAHGDSPLSWASLHLRPGSILQKLSFGEHRISSKHVELNISDHGNGWGNSMDWNLLGEYLPDSVK